MGTVTDGVDSLPNGTGILLQDATGALIGGQEIAAQNLVVGNASNGIQVNGGSANTIQNNVVSGNRGYGIAIQNGSGNILNGNFVGTDATGALDRGNGLSGILLEDATGNTVSGNVISGNDANGVFLVGSTPTTDIANLIEANLIGTDASGMRDLGNSLMGVRVGQGVGPIIRGNVVSGNDNVNINVDTTAGQVLIEDNLIGTNITGNAALLAPVGFSTVGVILVGHDNVVRGNVISANPIDGVNIDGLNVPDGRGSGNVLQENLIGVGLDGMTPLGNGRYGVRIWRGASNNLIGTSRNRLQHERQRQRDRLQSAAGRAGGQ